MTRTNMSIEDQWKVWYNKYGNIGPRQVLMITLLAEGPSACYEIDTPPDRQEPYVNDFGRVYDSWKEEIDEFLDETPF